MSPNGMRSAAPAGRCDRVRVILTKVRIHDQLSQRVGPQVTDAAGFAGIAPGPTEAVVEQIEGLAWLELANRIAVVGGAGAQYGRDADLPQHWAGIM